MSNLENKNVLMIAMNGFQEDEFFRPLEALREEGANVHVASKDRQTITADSKESREYSPDLTFAEAKVSNYDAIIVPGGLQNPDSLRMEDDAVQLVRDFAEDGKTVAAICHGPWLLAEADILKGRNVTSYRSIKTDLENAGASWTDEAVIVDNGIITSRQPSDIDAFNRKIKEELLEGRHDRKIAA
jgi:protease I